jgi:hypothetical protein
LKFFPVFLPGSFNSASAAIMISSSSYVSGNIRKGRGEVARAILTLRKADEPGPGAGSRQTRADPGPGRPRAIEACAVLTHTSVAVRHERSRRRHRGGGEGMSLPDFSKQGVQFRKWAADQAKLQTMKKAVDQAKLELKNTQAELRFASSRYKSHVDGFMKESKEEVYDEYHKLRALTKKYEEMKLTDPKKAEKLKKDIEKGHADLKKKEDGLKRKAEDLADLRKNVDEATAMLRKVYKTLNQ